jgi:hypothetical protein
VRAAAALIVALATVGLGAESAPAQQGAVAHFSEAHRLLGEGRPRAAEREFLAALEEAEGTQLASYAQLGLAWTALARGDLAESEVMLEDALPEAGLASPGAEVLLALLRGRDGKTAEAVTELDLAHRKLRDDDLRDAAFLAKGYVLYWAGSFLEAASAFDVVAVPGSGAPLVDDARYGAAWSRWKAGQKEVATAALAALAAEPSSRPETEPPPRSLIELRPDAILADAVRRYRRAGLQRPERMIVVLLDADGAARARKGLRRIQGAADDAPPPPTVAPAPTPPPFEPFVLPTAVSPPEASPAVAESPAPGLAERVAAAWWLPAGLAAAVIALALVIALRRVR